MGGHVSAQLHPLDQLDGELPSQPASSRGHSMSVHLGWYQPDVAPCEVRVGSWGAASCSCRLTSKSPGEHTAGLTVHHLRMLEHPVRWTLAQALQSKAWQIFPHLNTSLRLLQAWIFAALDDEAQAAKFYTLAALYSLPAVRSALELRLDGFTIFSIVACAVHVQVRGRAAFPIMHALVLCR